MFRPWRLFIFVDLWTTFKFLSSWIVCITLLVIISARNSLRHRQSFIVCVQYHFSWSRPTRPFCIAINIVYDVWYLSFEETSNFCQSEVCLFENSGLLVFFRIEVVLFRSKSISCWPRHSAVYFFVKIGLLNLRIVEIGSVTGRSGIRLANKTRYALRCISFCVEVLFVFLSVVELVSFSTLHSVPICVCSFVVLVIFEISGSLSLRFVWAGKIFLKLFNIRISNGLQLLSVHGCASSRDRCVGYFSSLTYRHTFLPK